MSKPPAASPGCPICRKPVQPRFRPFCSARCADIDLGRWFGEVYRAPGEALEADGEDDDLAG